MTDAIDFENVTVEELATYMLDSLRIDLGEAKLESELDETGQKFLAAMRKVAQEDPQAVADGFVALSVDMAAAEAAIEDIEEMRGLLGKIFSQGEDPTEAN